MIISVGKNAFVVRGVGLEPTRHCWRQDLNLVRLPISPPALVTEREKADGQENPTARSNPVNRRF
jgi:hypothetical protein